MSETVAQQDPEQEENRAQGISPNEEGISVPIQDDGLAVSQYHHKHQPFKLHLIQTEGDPNLRWLILDGARIARSGQFYCCHRLAQAVKYFWERGHRKIIICIPEWMKLHKNIVICGIHYLDKLQDHLQDLLVYTPFEAKEASFMEKLAKNSGALIVTLPGPDSWSEPYHRILQFTFMKDSFMLPDDPCGKEGPDLSTLLLSKNNIKEISVKILIKDLLGKWEDYSNILKDFKELNLSFSEEPGNDDLPLVIIDGGNVAMSHGLNIFYSFFGIYRAVLHYWNKGYRNIIVCVPNWRKNSEYTGYGYEYLHKLSERGLVALTPSICYDDRFMLKEAKDKTGWIVTNDQFKDFGKEWKDTKNRCIPFEFNGNHFIPITISSEIHQDPQIPASSKVYNYGKAIVQDP
ncbi:NEDD4-binding protein 1-like [Alosa sapidissima]|uniref:NEDD4-binding protein 1-like n=1 Tax=Alosa sapidissima TaxID=34773 RepID=UPI001C0898F9|nr:NEDD4-binding protein 1-like [Alosa sapidissima]